MVKISVFSELLLLFQIPMCLLNSSAWFCNCCKFGSKKKFCFFQKCLKNFKKTTYNFKTKQFRVNYDTLGLQMQTQLKLLKHLWVS